MISDTLRDAVSEIDRYLHTVQFVGVYGYEGDPLYNRIAELRDDMDAMRAYLDDPRATPFDHGSDLTAQAELSASLFLAGMGARVAREEAIAHNAYTCGWLNGHAAALDRERSS